MGNRILAQAAGTLYFAGFLVFGSHDLCAQGTAITYQGRLQSGSDFANGSYDISLSLWTDATGSNQVAGTITNAATGITNGLFTLTLDFGTGIFTGSDRWLEIGVRTNGSLLFTTLSPRQKITVAPYAIYAGGVVAAGITGTIPPASIGNGSISSNMLAPGTAAANLVTSGQSAVPGGAMVFSSNANASNLTAAGYTRLGGPVDLAWQPGAGSLSPDPRGGHTAVWTGNR